MSTLMVERPWSTDPTRFCERLAERLRREGYPYPLAAAVALTARGARSASLPDFARDLGLTPDHLARIEAGHVALDDLPPTLVAAVRAVAGFDWHRATGGHE